MSPEQAAGADNLDRRADLYALGCVAYFLLTGTEPFRHDNPMMVLMQQISEEPEPMDRRYRRLQIEPAFEHLIRRMMAKGREDRPASADEVGRLLRELVLPSTWDQEVAQAWWAKAKVPMFEATFDPTDAANEPRLVRKI